jgi:hypothetical protein
VERLGERLLSRVVPKAEAHAACCGSCCNIATRCFAGIREQLYTCYAEQFEGCFVYYQRWVPSGSC